MICDLDDALRVAAQAHAHQKDRYGRPFVLHPLRMMLRLEGVKEQIAALLHDVVEKSGWTLADLRREGFSGEVIKAVDLLTRREDEAYLDYIVRVAVDPLATRVKEADLQDHIDSLLELDRQNTESERLDRYRQALRILRERRRADD